MVRWATCEHLLTESHADLNRAGAHAHGLTSTPLEQEDQSRKCWDERSRRPREMAITINVNGLRHAAKATADTPLLYVLRDELKLRGPKFGCGLAQCGACSALLDGQEIRTCVTPVAAATGRRVTTLEGLPALHAGRKQSAAG